MTYRALFECAGVPPAPRRARDDGPIRILEVLVRTVRSLIGPGTLGHEADGSESVRRVARGAEEGRGTSTQRTEVNTVLAWILAFGALVFAKYIAKLVIVRF